VVEDIMEVVADVIPVEVVVPVTRNMVDTTSWETIEEQAK
jgi:hypothetical protein